jgi:hypothetical protein
MLFFATMASARSRSVTFEVDERSDKSDDDDCDDYFGEEQSDGEDEEADRFVLVKTCLFSNSC